jgi:hypothetical protein
MGGVSDRRVPGDEELRQELDQLLGSSSSSNRILDSPAVNLLASSTNGIVNLGSELKHYLHEERPGALLRSSLPSGNHQLRGLGLPSLLSELPRCHPLARAVSGV